MKAVDLLDDRTLVAAFEDLSLPNERFKHQDHIRVAWFLQRNDPFVAALNRFVRNLKRFATHHRVPDLYHETITLFYFYIIAERIDEMPRDHGWEEFREANPDLFTSHREFLLKHYTANVLDSAAAKEHFLLPSTVDVGNPARAS